MAKKVFKSFEPKKFSKQKYFADKPDIAELCCNCGLPKGEHYYKKGNTYSVCMTEEQFKNRPPWRGLESLKPVKH